MQTVITIGFDIAVFQVHGVDAVGQVVIRRQLKRRHVLAFFQKLPPRLVGIEACASSHHWSRQHRDYRGGCRFVVDRFHPLAGERTGGHWRGVLPANAR